MFASMQLYQGRSGEDPKHKLIRDILDFSRLQNAPDPRRMRQLDAADFTDAKPGAESLSFAGNSGDLPARGSFRENNRGR